MDYISNANEQAAVVGGVSEAKFKTMPGINIIGATPQQLTAWLIAGQITQAQYDLERARQAKLVSSGRGGAISPGEQARLNQIHSDLVSSQQAALQWRKNKELQDKLAIEKAKLKTLSPVSNPSAFSNALKAVAKATQNVLQSQKLTDQVTAPFNNTPIPAELTPDQAAEMTGDKIFGIDKNVVLISGGAFLLFFFLKKKKKI